MATSIVKLYYGTNEHPWMLTANKFFVIEDIATYLNTYSNSCITLNNFQYQKCTLELAIVCDLSQHNSEPLYTNGIKYVSIQNSDSGKVYYFYVKKAEWRAKQSVKLFLVMDVANTFKPLQDFEFSPKTKITREHKERLIPERARYVYFELEGAVLTAPTEIVNDKILMQINYEDLTATPYTNSEENYFNSHNNHRLVIARIYDDTLGRLLVPFTEYNPIPVSFSYSVVAGENPSLECSLYLPKYIKGHKLLMNFDGFEPTSSTAITCYHKIDLQSEGLSPMLYKKYDSIIERTSLLKQDWYLLYRNQNEPTEALTNPVQCFLIPAQETAVNIGSIQSGGRIKAENLELNKFYYIPLAYFQTITLTLSDGTTISGNISTQANLVIIVQKVDDTHIVVHTTQVDTNNYIRASNSIICEYFNVSNLPCVYKITDTYNNSYTYQQFRSDSFPLSWTSEGVSPYVLDGIDKLDRTDAKNIKLIKLPYIPYDLRIQNDKLIITDTDFEHVSLQQSGGAVIEILKLKNLNIKFNYNFIAGLSPLHNLERTIMVSNLTSRTYLRNDNYESKMLHSDYLQYKFVYDSFGYSFMLERMDLDYYRSLSAVNRLQFTIKYVVSTTITSRFMFQFPHFKSNNGKEDYDNVMPVARNNELVLYNVPYINYIRTGYNYDVKNKNAQMSSTWASVGLGGLSTAAALLFPSVPLKIAGVVASLVSTATSVKNAVVNQLQAERNLDQKMLEAKNQSTAVSGSDDVDLMSVYTSNRAKMCLYKCNPIIEQLIKDLFFYTGYISNRMGIPDIKSRLNFNYIEADIIITDYRNMSEEIMTELVGLYKTGLTFIHNVSERSSDPWDLEQKYENFERSLIYL